MTLSVRNARDASGMTIPDDTAQAFRISNEAAAREWVVYE
jgi:hypothetical protein